MDLSADLDLFIGVFPLFLVIMFLNVTAMSGITIHSAEGKGGDDLQHILMTPTESRVRNRP